MSKEAVVFHSFEREPTIEESIWKLKLWPTKQAAAFWHPIYLQHSTQAEPEEELAKRFDAQARGYGATCGGWNWKEKFI